MLISPILSGVLHVSPSDTLLSQSLLGVGIFLGLFMNLTCDLKSIFLAVNLYNIHRDFHIPKDMVLISGLPICVVNWTENRFVQFVFFILIAVSFPLSTSIEVPKHDWLPAFYAALYVGNLKLFRVKILGAALVVLRHFVPVKSYLLYGSLIFLKKHNHKLQDVDSLIQDSVKLVIFFLLNNEPWFTYLFPSVVVSYFIYKRFTF